MVRIIKEGKLPQEKEYKATCGNCNTIFEFFQKEGRVTYDQRDGDFITMTCPLCKLDVTVSVSVNYR